MTDAFAVGLMNQGITPSIWFAITFGLGVFLGGNLIIACLLSLLLAGIGFPIVWGVLGEALLVMYYTLLQNQMQNILLTGFQVTSVFIPTAIAALVFPYVKRAKGVWESSPYKTWRFLGLPVVVWGALVDLVYLGIILYYFVFNDAAKQFTVAGDFLLVGAWVLGVLWYFFWKQRSKTVGVDVSLTYGELPPE